MISSQKMVIITMQKEFRTTVAIAAGTYKRKSWFVSILVNQWGY